VKIASVAQVKSELKELPNDDLIAICLRLAKAKKDNKELLNYLLFEASDEHGYIKAAKLDILEGFKTINTSSLYLAKKTIRKVLKLVNKHISYSAIKETEVELLIDFCDQFNKLDINIEESKVLLNLYANVLKKISKAVSTLHEDLQFDYKEKVIDLGMSFLPNDTSL
jgi:hypothetical protein